VEVKDSDQRVELALKRLRERQRRRGRAELQLKWERKKLGRRSTSPLDTPHIVTGPEFKKQLSWLADVTGDSRFVSALSALGDCELLDQRGNWRRDILHTYLGMWTTILNYKLFIGIEQRVQSGVSLRLACAEVVNKQNLPGQSFDAVCKAVERLWREYKRQGLTVSEAERLVGIGRVLSRLVLEFEALIKKSMPVGLSRSACKQFPTNS
jgi:hypothetical protein